MTGKDQPRGAPGLRVRAAGTGLAGRDDGVVQLPAAQAGFPGHRGDRLAARLAVRSPPGYLGDRLGRREPGSSRVTGDDQRDLAQQAALGPAGQVGQGAPADLLVRLGQLPADHRAPPGPERRGQLTQGHPGPLAGLEEHQGAGLGGQLGEPAAPPDVLGRREALEAEPVAGQAGHGQRGGHRGRPGQHPDPGARLGRGRHQPVPGVADRGHARVRDQQHVLALAEHAEELVTAAPLDRVPVRDDPAGQLDAEGGGQPPQPPGVLRRYHGRRGEGLCEQGRRVAGPPDGHRGHRERAESARGIRAGGRRIAGR